MDSNAHELLLHQMVGDWNVKQRMWTESGAEATVLPTAIGRRRLIGGAFLEETIKLEDGPQDQLFSRVAYLNFNTINQNYEYFSIHTRAPQMMNARSYDTGSNGNLQRDLVLHGESFVSPNWGVFTNVAFEYRFEIGPVQSDQQVVRLYLTPRLSGSPKTFLAFEYLHTRE